MVKVLILITLRILKPTFLISFESTLRQRKNGSLVIQYTKEDFDSTLIKETFRTI